MLAIKRSAGVAPKVNLRNSKQARKCASNIHPGFETQGWCHQKSETGVSMAPQKGQELKKKKKKVYLDKMFIPSLIVGGSNLALLLQCMPQIDTNQRKLIYNWNKKGILLYTHSISSKELFPMWIVIRSVSFVTTLLRLFVVNFKVSCVLGTVLYHVNLPKVRFIINENSLHWKQCPGKWNIVYNIVRKIGIYITYHFVTGLTGIK